MWNVLMLKYRRNKFSGLRKKSDHVERCHDIIVFVFNINKLHHNLRVYKALI